jgi:2'-5' RNA ligase
MKRRVFIAINLPKKIKNRLEEYQGRHGGLPVRWIKKDSLHLTLVFIGYVTDDQLLQICRSAREVAVKLKPLFINFKKILFGPLNRPPRMIWLEGEASRELIKLKKELESALLDGDSGFYRPENRAFEPHITLARVKEGRNREISGQQAEIEQDFEARFEAGSLEVMESDLKRDGAEYIILESCPLG